MVLVLLTSLESFDPKVTTTKQVYKMALVSLISLESFDPKVTTRLKRRLPTQNQTSEIKEHMNKKIHLYKSAYNIYISTDS